MTQSHGPIRLNHMYAALHEHTEELGNLGGRRHLLHLAPSDAKPGQHLASIGRGIQMSRRFQRIAHHSTAWGDVCELHPCTRGSIAHFVRPGTRESGSPCAV